MSKFTYVDFDLQIERSPEAGSYRAQILDSPAGTASHQFSLPFEPLELDNFVLRLGRPRRGLRRVESPDIAAAKEFGKRLFSAVFDDEVRACLRSSIDEAARQDARLRIRLRLSDAPELANLPWEYLYNPALNRFLALSVKTPLVRYLELPERIRPLNVSPPLRALVMISSPSDVVQLDVEREWKTLYQALSDVPRVELERLEQATLPNLQRRLRKGDYHIFHFIGHGGFDRQSQDGVLVMEDERGRGTPVSGQQLGTILHDHDPLRLAVLNACEGARGASDDPFAGMAQSLVQQGIPAVVAMQFEITDDAAITFAREFYGAMADGYPVDAALAEARKSIFTRGNSLEWGTPVLFLRAPDGRIFDVAGAPRPDQPPRAVAPVEDAERERQLADLYTRALSSFYTAQWEQAISLLGEIVAQEPDHEDAASKLEEAQRQLRLSHHYSEGTRAFQTRAWKEAVEHLQAVLDLDPAYRDAARILDEAKRQSSLAELYAEAGRLHEAKAWQAVINVFERIAAQSPAYPDPQRLLPSAREGLAAEAKSKKLSALYSQGLAHMDAAQWPEALKSFQEVQELEPAYCDTEALLARTRRELTALEDRTPAPVAAPRASVAGRPLAKAWKRLGKLEVRRRAALVLVCAGALAIGLVVWQLQRTPSQPEGARGLASGAGRRLESAERTSPGVGGEVASQSRRDGTTMPAPTREPADISQASPEASEAAVVETPSAQPQSPPEGPQPGPAPTEPAAEAEVEQTPPLRLTEEAEPTTEAQPLAREPEATPAQPQVELGKPEVVTQPEPTAPPVEGRVEQPQPRADAARAAADQPARQVAPRPEAEARQPAAVEPRPRRTQRQLEARPAPEVQQPALALPEPRGAAPRGDLDSPPVVAEQPSPDEPPQPQPPEAARTEIQGIVERQRRATETADLALFLQDVASSAAQRWRTEGSKLFENWVNITSTTSDVKIEIKNVGEAEVRFRSVTTATSKKSGNQVTWNRKVRWKLTRAGNRWLIAEQQIRT